MKCIICGKIISTLYVDDNWLPEEAMWNSAVVGKIIAGYGSKYDTDTFFIGICDNCIDQKLKDGSLGISTRD